MRRVEAAVQQMEQSLEPGRTEAEAWADYHHKFMATEGQYVATRLFQTGSRTFPYFQECGDRIMENGDLVCLDTDALGYEGYAVDFSRSFICGDATPTPSQRKLYSLAREQLETNAAALAPGIPYEELADLAWPIPEGYQESRYYCVGHGLGVSGEFPNIPHKVSGKPYPLSGTIEPGMVICLESYVGCREAGEGIKLENQYLIHEKGVEQMSIYPFDQHLGV
jgi:Xaa-Pro aminopeptidase